MSLQERLRADLTAAMRARDRVTVRALRVALAAVANAEAVPLTADRTETEVDRRELTDDDVRRIVAAERDDFLAADHPDAAAVLAGYVAM